MKSNKWLITGAAMGFAGVAIGAIGSHALKSCLTPEATDTFRTGVLYHLIHAVVILAVSMAGRKALMKSCPFFLAGIMLFSFSLYSYSLTSVKTFAMITPIGGVSFLLGWLFIIRGALKENHPPGRD